MIPTVWRLAFRSASAASAMVDAVLAKTRDQILAVILCENLDSNFRRRICFGGCSVAQSSFAGAGSLALKPLKNSTGMISGQSPSHRPQ